MDSEIVELARACLDADVNRYYPQECWCNTCQLARAVIAMADVVSKAADALKAVGSCSQCGLGLEIGGQSRHRDCSFDPEKETIDLDTMVQEAWEACDRLRRSAEGGK